MKNKAKVFGLASLASRRCSRTTEPRPPPRYVEGNTHLAVRSLHLPSGIWTRTSPCAGRAHRTYSRPQPCSSHMTSFASI